MTWPELFAWRYVEGKLDVHEDGSTLSGMELAAGKGEKLVKAGINPHTLVIFVSLTFCTFRERIP
jgi:hypothetical protein